MGILGRLGSAAASIFRRPENRSFSDNVIRGGARALFGGAGRVGRIARRAGGFVLKNAVQDAIGVHSMNEFKERLGNEKNYRVAQAKEKYGQARDWVRNKLGMSPLPPTPRASRYIQVAREARDARQEAQRVIQERPQGQILRPGRERGYLSPDEAYEHQARLHQGRLFRGQGAAGDDMMDYNNRRLLPHEISILQRNRDNYGQYDPDNLAEWHRAMNGETPRELPALDAQQRVARGPAAEQMRQDIHQEGERRRLQSLVPKAPGQRPAPITREMFQQHGNALNPLEYRPGRQRPSNIENPMDRIPSQSRPFGDENPAYHPEFGSRNEHRDYVEREAGDKAYDEYYPQAERELDWDNMTEDSQKRQISRDYMFGAQEKRERQRTKRYKQARSAVADMYTRRRETEEQARRDMLKAEMEKDRREALEARMNINPRHMQAQAMNEIRARRGGSKLNVRERSAKDMLRKTPFKYSIKPDKYYHATAPSKNWGAGGSDKRSRNRLYRTNGVEGITPLRIYRTKDELVDEMNRYHRHKGRDTFSGFDDLPKALRERYMRDHQDDD